MTNKPLVSVTVITYCSSKTVTDTLESIKNQSYQNLELIISDDCSKDNTVDICQKWIDINSDRFVRVKLIRSDKNTGTSANINRAIKECHGEYRKSIAGDDILEPDCILENLKFIGDADAVFSDLVYFDDKGLKEFKSDDLLLKALTTLSPRKRLKLYCQTMIFCNVPTWFVRTSIYNKIGLYDEASTILEDVPFLCRLFASDLKIKYLRRVTVRYRSGGISHDPGRRVRMQKILADAYIKYCKSNITIDTITDFLLMIDRNIWTFTAKLGIDFLLRSYLSKYNIITPMVTRLVRKQYLKCKTGNN